MSERDRWDVTVIMQDNEAIPFRNVIGVPRLQGGVLVIDTPEGEWYRIPTENFKYWYFTTPKSENQAAKVELVSSVNSVTWKLSDTDTLKIGAVDNSIIHIDAEKNTPILVASGSTQQLR